VAVFYALTAMTADSAKKSKAYDVFTSNRYSVAKFQGIILDTGAFSISLAGEQQVRALLDKILTLEIKLPVREDSIRFREGGLAKVISIVNVPTPISIIKFHVVTLNTLFLICLRDIDTLGVIYNNIRNVLV
jgi:hypothetical protein